MADELTVAIVGIDFPNDDKTKSNRRMELLLCPPGEPMDLVIEPKNPDDSNAISVWSARGIQVGYINAERAPWIGNRIRSGEDCQAVMQGLDGWSGFIRVRFGGDTPSYRRRWPLLHRPARPARLGVLVRSIRTPSTRTKRSRYGAHELTVMERRRFSRIPVNYAFMHFGIVDACPIGTDAK